MDSSSPPADLLCPFGETSCQFLQELQRLRQEVEVLKEQVSTDALTGLYNFRFFSTALPLEMERCRRSFQPLSIILLDIDHFKKFNDTWGHELGNHALVLVARQVALTIRKLDIACRFGGEEFVILLPNTDLRQAVSVAERLREVINNTPVIHHDEKITITASFGVDEFRGNHSDTPEGFVERVDAWLYRAKHSGRNCVKYPVIDTTPIATSVTPDEKAALSGMFSNDENNDNMHS